MYNIVTIATATTPATTGAAANTKRVLAVRTHRG